MLSRRETIKSSVIEDCSSALLPPHLFSTGFMRDDRKAKGFTSIAHEVYLRKENLSSEFRSSVAKV